MSVTELLQSELETNLGYFPFGITIIIEITETELNTLTT